MSSTVSASPWGTCSKASFDCPGPGLLAQRVLDLFQVERIEVGHDGGVVREVGTVHLHHDAPVAEQQRRLPLAAVLLVLHQTALAVVAEYLGAGIALMLVIFSLYPKGACTAHNPVFVR